MWLNVQHTFSMHHQCKVKSIRTTFTDLALTWLLTHNQTSRAPLKTHNCEMCLQFIYTIDESQMNFSHFHSEFLCILFIVNILRDTQYLPVDFQVFPLTICKCVLYDVLCLWVRVFFFFILFKLKIRFCKYSNPK